MEYGSPSIANIGLSRPELSPLNIPSSSILPNDNEGIDVEESGYIQENLTLHNWKDEIKFDIKTGNVYNRFIDIDFGPHHKDITKLYIITNDGQSFSVNPHTVSSSKQDIKWDIKGTSNAYWKDLEIYSITVMDGKGSQNIYCNSNPNFLANFDDNLGKGFK